MNASPLQAALQAGAQGLYALEAATGLIIAHGTWLAREDFGGFISHGAGTAAIDWEAAISALDGGRLPSSGGERRMLRLAASLADQVLATWLFGGVAAALREDGSATLDEHCCYFRRPDRVLVGGHRNLRSRGTGDCPVTAIMVTRCDGRDSTDVQYPPICTAAVIAWSLATGRANGCSVCHLGAAWSVDGCGGDRVHVLVMACERAYWVLVPGAQRMGVPSATFWTISADLPWTVATAMSLTEYRLRSCRSAGRRYRCPRCGLPGRSLRR
jgi:hypothetical protein